jgi:hypothetical protein
MEDSRKGLKDFAQAGGIFASGWLRGAIMAVAFVVGYFVVLRFVRVLLVSMVIMPAAVSLDAGAEAGFLLYYEPGSTGIYVYRMDVIGAAIGVVDSAGQQSASPGDLARVDSAGRESASPGDLARADSAGRESASPGDLARADSVGQQSASPGDLARADSVGQQSASPGDLARVDSAEGGPISMTAAGGKPYYLFKGFGDQFFLFGGVMMIALGFWRHVGWLFLFHAGVSVLNVALFLLGVTGVELPLQLMDFLIDYLVPAASMLWVVVLYGAGRPRSKRNS